MSGLFNDDTLSLYLKLKEAMKQYVRDAMPGGVLNREIKPQDTLDAAALSLSPVPLVGDAAGLLADGYRYATDPSSRTPLNYGLSALGALPFVPAMGAVTAWHGSPHKFDKFSLDKIGTGEGAQAYGHGSYLAESPGVAKDYAKKLSQVPIDGGYDSIPRMVTYGKTKPRVIDQNAPSNTLTSGETALLYIGMNKGSAFDAAQDIREMIRANPPDVDHYKSALKVLESGRLKASKVGQETGHLYKTDIPDEAVARFLDWDKPLSEQAHVMDLINKQEAQRTQSVLDRRLQTLANVGEDAPNAPILKKQIEILREEVANPQSGVGSMTGGEYYNYLRRRDIQPSEQANMFRNAGIPGIRYLDGGSRGAGTGTSNFVVFDPELIRILERNGVATGAKPWAPGEWEGLFKK